MDRPIQQVHSDLRRPASSMAVAAGVITLLLWVGQFAFLKPPFQTWINPVLGSLFILIMTVFGVLIVRQAHNRRYGWLLLGTTSYVSFLTFAALYSQYALLVVPEANLPLGLFAAWL